MEGEFPIERIRKRLRDQISLFKYKITPEQEEEIITLYELNYETYSDTTFALHIETYVQRMADTPDLFWREGRRPTVFAKIVAPESLSLPSFPKDEKTVVFLMSQLGSGIPFCLLSENQKQSLVKSMYPMEIEEGVVLIKEGDLGAEMYIVEEGEFVVSVKGKQTNIMRAGAVFGELALLHGIPRTATVTATRKSKVWSAEQTSFSCIRLRNQIYRTDLAKEALKENCYFNGIFKSQADIDEALNKAVCKFIPAHTHFTVNEKEVVIILKEADIIEKTERSVRAKELVHASFYTKTNVECVVLSLED